MVSIRKVVGILSCGFLLWLGLSSAAQAEHEPSPSDVMKTDSVSDRQGFQSDDDKQKHGVRESSRAGGAKTIQGELSRVEKGNYFVKVDDGEEIRVRTDKTTKMKGKIKKGDRIEVKVNDQNHALSMRKADARH